jgi:hypothetical protein
VTVLGAGEVPPNHKARPDDSVVAAGAVVFLGNVCPYFFDVIIGGEQVAVGFQFYLQIKPLMQWNVADNEAAVD